MTTPSKRTVAKTHPGVSIKLLKGGKHRLRWREKLADGTREAQSWTVYGSDGDAEVWAIRVYKSLMKSGTFYRPADTSKPEQEVRAEVADLRDLFADWMDDRRMLQRDSPGTQRNRAESLLRVERLLRNVLGLDDGVPIPVSALKRKTCLEVGKLVKSDGQRRRLMRDLHSAWVWADKDDEYPGLGDAPARSRMVSPAPVPPKALLAPTWPEVRILLSIASRTKSNAGDALTVACWTGFRIGQVLRLRVGDFTGLYSTTPHLTLRPELGKSKQEKRGRTVPVSPALVPLIRHLVRGLNDGTPLFRTKPTTRTFLEITKMAVEAGVRPGVFGGTGRGNQRTSHWCRSAFQAFLVAAAVKESAIDELVGHKPRSVRVGAYVPATEEDLVKAVGLLPPLSWAPPPSNVASLADVRRNRSA